MWADIGVEEDTIEFGGEFDPPFICRSHFPEKATAFNSVHSIRLQARETGCKIFIAIMTTLTLILFFAVLCSVHVCANLYVSPFCSPMPAL